MAMQDLEALAGAIASNKMICLKTRKGRITKARIIFACLWCGHDSGTFSGSVNYQIEGQDMVCQDTFYNMWVKGWEPLV